MNKPIRLIELTDDNIMDYNQVAVNLGQTHLDIWTPDMKGVMIEVDEFGKEV